MPKLVIHLSKPAPAAHDCLPHAAMSLGAAGAAGMRPYPHLVHTLVLEEQLGNWVLYRMDDRGGFIGDSWHGTREDALWQIKKEFGEVPSVP
jgi:hypothetical protein